MLPKTAKDTKDSQRHQRQSKQVRFFPDVVNAAHQDWEIEDVDIESVYLNTPLKEEIYMRHPRGVLKPGQEGKVLRLLKGLYGLKQASRGWYIKMAGVFMNKMSFKRSAIDHSVFY